MKFNGAAVKAAKRKALIAPDANRMLRTDGGGRGLSFGTPVASIGALQPSQQPKRCRAMHVDSGQQIHGVVATWPQNDGVGRRADDQ